MSHKVWDEVTSQTWNSYTIEVWERISNFILHFMMDAISYPHLDLSLTMSVKGVQQVLLFICIIVTKQGVSWDYSVVRPAISYYSDLTWASWRLKSKAAWLFNSFLGYQWRKYQSYILLVIVRGTHKWPVDSPNKGSVMWKVCIRHYPTLAREFQGFRVWGKFVFWTLELTDTPTNLANQVKVGHALDQSRSVQSRGPERAHQNNEPS